MHGEDALEREAIVHDGEDRLLDLARVERPADDDLGPRRVEADERLRPRAVLVGIGRDRRRVQDERLRLHLVELVVRRVDEERLREERMPRALRDHAHRDAMGRVGARERVDHVDVSLAQARCDLFTQLLEVLLGDLRVDVAPPDPTPPSLARERRTCPSASAPCARRCRRRAARPRRAAHRRVPARARRAARSSDASRRARARRCRAARARPDRERSRSQRTIVLRLFRVGA